MKDIAVCKKINKQADLAFGVQQDLQSTYNRIFVEHTDPKRFHPIIKMGTLDTTMMKVVEVYCSGCDHQFTIQTKNKYITEDKPYYEMIDEKEFFEHFPIVEIYQ